MDDRTANILWLLGGLVLVGSALIAMRPSVGAILRAVLGWGVVAAVAWMLIANQARLQDIATEIGERFGIGGQQVVGDTIRIDMSSDGHFWAQARINGMPKRLLIDSGATLTALSSETAASAGVQVTPRDSGFPVIINTANGQVIAQRGRIETLSVGGLETRDLGVVVAPNFAGTDVLGMNFLSRLGSWRVEGRTLILEPKRNSDVEEGNPPQQP